jgi:type II secretory pathway pseudopilin PulG
VNNVQTNTTADDSGLGIVEIVVSMFLLALLAVAFLPLLIQGMKTSVRNSTVATASQLLDQQIGAVRALPPTCDAVSAFDDAPVPETTDARGTTYLPKRKVLACPTTYPGVVRVEVTVAEAGDVLAEAVTLVYLQSESAPAPVPTP